MGSKAPDAPDYKGAAEQQGADSRWNTQYQTEANRPNIQTPWGSSTWQNTPGRDGMPNWENTVSLSGPQQGALDDQMAIQAGISGFAKDRLGNVQNQGPMDWGNLPGMAGTPNVPDFYGANLPGMGQMPQSTRPVGGPRPGEGGPGDPFTQIRNYGSLGGMMEPAGGGGGMMQGPSAPSGGGKFATFEGQAGGLQPQGARSQGGGGPGSQNPGGMMSNVRDRAETALYDRTASRLDPRMAEQKKSLANSLYNKGLREGDAAFDNEMKKFGQTETDAYQTAYNEAIMGGGQEASRTFGMGLQAGQFQNQTQAQQFGQASQLRGEQGAAASAEFDQNMRLAGMQDQQRQQLMNEQLAYGSQGFGQQMQAAQFQNQQRQQSIAEEMQRRGMGINEINAMLHGQQVQMPGMPSFMGAGKADTTDYLGAAQSAGDYGLDKFSADQAMMQSILSGASGVGAAFAGKPSDIRLKYAVEETGTMGPLTTYKWRWNELAEKVFGLTGKGVGFLAHEVAKVFPERVKTLGGTHYLGIDYDGVYAELGR